MIYKEITSENFSQLEKSLQEMKKRVKDAMKNDRFANYGTEYFSIQGMDAILDFCDKYDVELWQGDEIKPKTDGKTSAEIVPYTIVEFHYDGRENKISLSGMYSGTNIYHLIEFNGVKMTPGFHFDGKPTHLLLWNDNTDYYNYLPYNWEKDNPAPNKVGTITDKKIAEWSEWLLKRKDVAETEREKREGTVATFLRKIDEIPESYLKRKKIWDNRGFIEKNGLVFEWQISNGVIHTEIKVSYDVKSGADKIDSFLQMCRGEF